MWSWFGKQKKCHNLKLIKNKIDSKKFGISLKLIAQVRSKEMAGNLKKEDLRVEQLLETFT